MATTYARIPNIPVPPTSTDPADLRAYLKQLHASLTGYRVPVGPVGPMGPRGPAGCGYGKVEEAGTFSPSHKAKVTIDGKEYWVYLEAVES